MAAILIDASWWAGGNRRRGIGKYLSYFFEYVFEVGSKERVWLFPAAVPAAEIADFTARFGGTSAVIDTKITPGEQAAQLERIIKERSIDRALLSSPFERPWSLLDLIESLRKHRLQVQAIVFDLLPLQHETEILSAWPMADQQRYRAGLKLLAQADGFWAISPQVAGQLENLLGISPQKIGVLKFGLVTTWLRAPAKGAPVHRPHSERLLALTISGGEWRKNLSGTIAYFASQLLKTHDLSIICKLSLKEHWRFRRIALQLDAYPLIRFLGEVTEREKWRQLYSADVFLFLSLAEGLGIPLLEARAAGVKRIIISPQLKAAGFDKLVPGCEVAAPTAVTNA
jgi:glycosyltransferase involved in cell wall biosynthesis